ncbi:MAG: tryptophan synthase subunit alpha [Candidatus Nitrosocosmicus sp.]
MKEKINKVISKFSDLRKNNEKALITYVVAGYPDIDTSRLIIENLIEHGADIVEVGIPFSDPMADGPIIQKAFAHALEKNVTPDDCLKMINLIKSKYSQVPILVMTYSNIIFSRKDAKFLKTAVSCGVDGLIVPDLTFEEAENYLKVAEDLNLATVFLAAPNTDSKRLAKITSISTGFVYMVSVYGITGSRNQFEKYTFDSIRRTLTTTSKLGKPLAVGFGISSAQDAAKMIEAGADGIIIGSSLTKIVSDFSDDKSQMLKSLGAFIEQMKKICKITN